MDYEKKYKNALEWARQVMNGETGFIRKEVEEIFPELKESEDERIRKRIYNYINVTLDDNESTEKEKWLAWLEKQGEQESFGDVEQKVFDDLLNNSEQLWSEDDEKKLHCICAWVKDYPRKADFKEEMYQTAKNYVEWLESLKLRQSKVKISEQDWSEEDEERLNSCLNILQAKTLVGNTETINTKWLKSFKERLNK